MTSRQFLRLPINADEGFPQTFRLDFENRTYRCFLYVNLPEPEVEQSLDTVMSLPDPESGAFMVLRVSREGTVEPEVIFQRKLVLDLEYEAAELAFLFREIKVARRNLNGIGAFGSSVIGGIASRWGA